MPFLELLLDNPLILVIIFGIISSLFKKSKGKNQQVKPPNRQASFPETLLENPKFNNERRITAVQESMTRSNMDTIEELYQEKKANAQIVTLIEQQRALEQKLENVHSKKDMVTKGLNKSTSQSGGKQQIIDGVIWAEILGPPRSRSPHRVLKSK